MKDNPAEFAQPLCERAKLFFEAMANSSELREHLAKVDQAAQFEPREGEPFFVRIEAGKLEFGKKQKYAKHVQNGLYIIVSRTLWLHFYG